MDENKNVEIRSEEVQEILGTPPKWMVRWGTTVAFATFIALGWVGYFVRYPDTVSAPIKVTSTDPPKKLIAENNGYIAEILVNNEDTVETGQILLAFNTRAKFVDVLVLADYIISVKNLDDQSLLSFNPPRDLLLGELSEDLDAFFQKQEEMSSSRSRRYENYSIRQLGSQINKIRSSIEYEKKRKESVEKQLALANEQLTRDQNLYYEKLVTPERLRQSQAEVISLERTIQTIESGIRNKQFEINMIQNEISGVRRGSTESESDAFSSLKDSFVKLQNKVEDWTKKYLISSPIDGIVLITNENIGEQQFVSAGTVLMVVVPLKETETKGRIALDVTGSGKVQRGQKVIVKLKSYPFPEFGAVIGEVAWKGRVPNNNQIPIEVTFPEGLKTTTGKIIEPSQEMAGEAQIIMEEKRFIERVFESFRRVTS
jgi:multidrug resistance efflux pump